MSRSALLLLLCASCGGDPFVYVAAPLAVDAAIVDDDAGNLVMIEGPDARTKPAESAPIVVHKDAAPPETSLPAVDGAAPEASPPEAGAPETAAPEAAPTCTPIAPTLVPCPRTTISYISPNQYCHFTRAADGTNVVSAGTTPAACRCVETFDCACLRAQNICAGLGQQYIDCSQKPSEGPELWCQS